MAVRCRGAGSDGDTRRGSACTAGTLGRGEGSGRGCYFGSCGQRFWGLLEQNLPTSKHPWCWWGGSCGGGTAKGRLRPPLPVLLLFALCTQGRLRLPPTPATRGPGDSGCCDEPCPATSRGFLVQHAEFGSDLAKNKPFWAAFVCSEKQTRSETLLAPPFAAAVARRGTGWGN